MINFLRDDWQPKHITFGLFEPINTIGQTLAKMLTKLLDNYTLRRNIIIYVKDEGSNLNTMTIVLKSIISCDMFKEMFSKHLLWACIFQGFPICHNKGKKFTKTYDMCQSNLLKEICKNA